MAIGFGVYDALNAAPDFNAKRRDRLMETASLAQQTALVENQIGQQTQARQAVQSHVDQLQETLSKQGFMQKDFEAIKNLEEQQRASIAKGIGEYGNDVRKFLLMGGGSQLSAYKNSILQSEELRKGLQNVASLAQYQKDASDGKFIRNAVAFTPDGKQISIDFNSAVNGYSNGQFTDFQYGGSEKMADVNPEFYSKTPGPTHKYGVKVKDASGNTVTVGEPVSYSQIYNQIRQSGYSDEQARARATEYQQFVNSGGEPMRWATDKFDWHNEHWRTVAQGLTKAGTAPSRYGDLFTGRQTAPSAYQEVTNIFGRPGKLYGAETALTGETVGGLAMVNNLNYDKSGNFYTGKPSTGFVMTESGYQIPIKDNVVFSGLGNILNFTEETDNGTIPSAYQRGTVLLTEAEARAAGVWEDRWGPWNGPPDENFAKLNGFVQERDIPDGDQNPDRKIAVKVILPLPIGPDQIIGFDQYMKHSKINYSTGDYGGDTPISDAQSSSVLIDAYNQYQQYLKDTTK